MTYNIKKTNLYPLVYGIGDQVLFTNLIEDLAKRDNNLISIASPSFTHTLFNDHPLVHSVIDIAKIDLIHSHPDHPTFDSKLLDTYFDEVIFYDPYLSDYIKIKSHIIDIWRNLLKLPPTTNTLTDVKCNDIHIDSYNNIVQHIQTTEYIIVQLKGGTGYSGASDEGSSSSYIKSLKDYHDEYQLLTTLSNNFNNHHFIVVRTKENIYDERLFDIPNISFLDDVPLLELQYVINNCLTFISIDSCIQHFAANKNHCKRGIVIWGNDPGGPPHTANHEHNVNLITEKINQVHISDETIIKELEDILNYINRCKWDEKPVSLKSI